ncbi:MAG: type II pantothenate kinase [Clostridia bacterium]|nr:type II pantothenate kinase [Clostridia bacterium]MBQ8235450.1 type II pantothenate kinase [Clostridia bacterium]MBQ8398914.1 type II pantothenate kinase [Clostridia bacterium]
MITIGIDVGGSATKIVAFQEGGQLMEPLFVRATDPVTSIYGALGRFTAENGIALSDIDRIMVTGAGAAFVGKELYGRPCFHVSEFESLGRGGLYLSKFEKAIVVSMGTGTAIVCAQRDGKNEYLGGTGVGGGTLIGLSRELVGIENPEHLSDLAKDGDLSRIDLRVSDLTGKKDQFGLPLNMTASNFGKVSDLADKSDRALGLFNMVFETVGMMAVFAARSKDIKDIVLTGRLSTLAQAPQVFEGLNRMFDVHFTIPVYSQFGTVIGAALCGRE